MNLKNYQTLPIAILQERVKISSSCTFLERKLDFHLRMFSSSFHLFLLMLHYKNLSIIITLVSSYKQWPLYSKLATHHNAHGYQKPLDCQEKLWRLLLLPNSYLCNAVIQSGWSPCVDCGYIGFSAFLTAMLFCYNCFIPSLSAYFWKVVLKRTLTDIWELVNDVLWGNSIPKQGWSRETRKTNSILLLHSRYQPFLLYK